MFSVQAFFVIFECPAETNPIAGNHVYKGTYYFFSLKFMHEFLAFEEMRLKISFGPRKIHKCRCYFARKLSDVSNSGDFFKAMKLTSFSEFLVGPWGILNEGLKPHFFESSAFAQWFKIFPAALGSPWNQMFMRNLPATWSDHCRHLLCSHS